MKKILLGTCLLLISSGISEAKLQNAEQITKGIYDHSPSKDWCNSNWKFGGTEISVDDSIKTISEMIMEMQDEQQKNFEISEYKVPENYGTLTLANWNYLLFREMCRQILNQEIPNSTDNFSDIFLEVIKTILKPV